MLSNEKYILSEISDFQVFLVTIYLTISKELYWCNILKKGFTQNNTLARSK
jgi:hypothetical protein